MGWFNRDKGAASGGGWADQAQQAQQMAEQAMKDAGYSDGGPLTAQTVGDASGQMYADRDEITAYGQELQRIIAVGQPGTAVISSATDTGERVAGNPWYQLEVEVTLPGAEAYTVSKREMVAPQFLANYAAGSSHGVAVDPEDPQNIAFTS